jgi:hypothetical protein
MELAFVEEARLVGFTVIVDADDGRALIASGGRCGRMRRGEALCGVIEP